MKLSLSTKSFLGMSLAVGAFCLLQTLGMIWMEFREVYQGEEGFYEEASEIAVLASVSSCVFILLAGGFWFFSRRLMAPLSDITETAHRISAGYLKERITTNESSPEINRLATTLNCAFDRHQEALDRLERFAGSAAHQLRTPLAAIQNTAEVCLLSERSESECQECISDILGITRELSGILDKLLDMARLNPSRIRNHFALVNLKDEITTVLDQFRPCFDSKGLNLNISDLQPSVVLGDRALLEEAIRNVLENAVQYTPDGGSIGVSLQTNADRIVLSIADTGPGFPDQLRKTFSRGIDQTRALEGQAGRFGLSLAMEILRIHEGSIEINPGPDVGSVVSLSWPFNPALTPHHQPRP